MTAVGRRAEESKNEKDCLGEAHCCVIKDWAGNTDAINYKKIEQQRCISLWASISDLTLPKQSVIATWIGWFLRRIGMFKTT